MVFEKKTVLIADDSEIDREILKNILGSAFEYVEVSTGLDVIEYFQEKKGLADVVVLDISMPGMSGFDVVEFLREYETKNPPLIISTSEANTETVLRAAHLQVFDFIKKPFVPQDVIQRIYNLTGTPFSPPLDSQAVACSKQYIDGLESLYRQYLRNHNKDVGVYERAEAVMRIFLGRYRAKAKDESLTDEKIDLIAKAAFFCDIGFMLIPDPSFYPEEASEEFLSLERDHPRFGRDVIRMFRDERCSFFVETCTEICLHHHERYDGAGYPHGVLGRNLSMYSQLCHLILTLDDLLKKYGTLTSSISLVIQRLKSDRGLVHSDLFDLLDSCAHPIRRYYQSLGIVAIGTEDRSS